MAAKPTNIRWIRTGFAVEQYCTNSKMKIVILTPVKLVLIF